jgi:hypothetical protein
MEFVQRRLLLGLAGLLVLCGSLAAWASDESPLPAVTPRAIFVPENEFDIPIAALQSQANNPTEFSYGKGSFGLSFGHMLTSFLAIQANSSFLTFSSTNTTPGGTELDLTVGPSFKFAVDHTGIRNAFFLTFGAGIHYGYINTFSPAGYSYTEASQSTTSFAYYVEFGKAFALFHNVSYSPAVSVSGFSGHDIFNGDRDANPLFQLTPLRIAIVF